MLLLLELTVWSVCIFGVCGSIGHKKIVKEENVHVMVAMYDPLTGQAFAGPASLQAPPSNVLPKLDFEADADGGMWITPPTWGVNQNGVVGFGRYIK